MNRPGLTQFLLNLGGYLGARTSEVFPKLRMSCRRWIIGGIGVGLAAIGLALLLQSRLSAPPAAPIEDPTVRAIPTNSEPVASTTKRLVVSSISGVAAEFTWSAEVPTSWEAEAVPEIQAINVYDPEASGESNLEKSQLFIRHFEANEFLTLATVDALSRTELTVAGRPAVRYEIEKKVGVADFAHQPNWRNFRHTVTDVRVSDSNPSVFYVFAKRPDLDQAVHDHFLETLKVDDTGEISSGVGTPVPSGVEGDSPEVVAPTAEFRARITKKSFGTFITPATSPVQPERFSGYHTGVDVEYSDTSDDVPVSAAIDATVVRASFVSGYGGLLVLKGSINGEQRYLLYGHVRVSSLPAVGSTVKRGDQVGVLGTQGPETDGERKHLHFAIYRDDPVNLRGYVQSESELSAWQNPLDLFN